MKPRSSAPRSSSGRSPARGGGARSGGGDRGPKGGRGGAPSRGPMDKPRALYGVVEIAKTGIHIKPTNRNQKFTIELDQKDLNGALDGEIVFVSRQEEKPQPHKPARLGGYAVRERLGSAQDVRNYSLLSLLEAGLQPNFPPKVVESCADFTVPELGNREDLRHLPLVTIDGEDARDFDDAVYARPADDGKGWYAIIAIADVAHYVTEGSILDKEAVRRGNSTYFPDRVIPMLPEGLSNDLCSLRPFEDRACMHVHVWIDEEGQISDWNIGRGLMKSAARLTYNQVQKALDGQPDSDTQPLLENIQYLYKAFKVLLAAREKRGALEINAPERKIIMDGEGGVAAVVPRERLEARQLIEEFMITANVVIATALEAKSAPCMYRVHDRPSAFKVATLAEFVKPLGLTLPTQQSEIETEIFNSVLRKVMEVPDLQPVINDLVLRCQMQAVYTPENIGHFGLALERYAHFTSPIRRYADLVNHRSLITAYDLGSDGLKPEDKNLMEEWAEQISQTERASMLAERACVDRFTAHFLQTQLGKEITGRISSVTNFGLFISLLGGIGEALVPMRLLPHDFYDFIEEQQALVGQRSGRIYRLGGKVSLMITGVDPILGSITGQLLGEGSADLEGFTLPDRPTRAPRRDDRGDRGGRPDRDAARPPRRDFGDRDRKPPSRDRDDRGGDRARPSSFGDRKPRFDSDNRDSRPAPRRAEGERSSYAPRPARGGDDRPPRRFDSDAPRPPRREDGGRAKPTYNPRGNPDRAPRYDADARPPRRDDRDDAPRPPYKGGRDAKPAFGARKPYGDAPRPARREEGERSSYAPRGGDRDDRPRRSNSDAPPRSYRGDASGDARPPRRDSEDRPRRAAPSSDAPRTYRPRSDGDARPPRRAEGERSSYAPRGDSRDRDDRPRRPSSDAPRPYRGDSERSGSSRGGPSKPPSRGGKPSYGGKPSFGGAPKPRGGSSRSR